MPHLNKLAMKQRANVKKAAKRALKELHATRCVTITAAIHAKTAWEEYTTVISHTVFALRDVLMVYGFRRNVERKPLSHVQEERTEKVVLKTVAIAF